MDFEFLQQQLVSALSVHMLELRRNTPDQPTMAQRASALLVLHRVATRLGFPASSARKVARDRRPGALTKQSTDASLRGGSLCDPINDFLRCVSAVLLSEIGLHRRSIHQLRSLEHSCCVGQWCST